MNYQLLLEEVRRFVLLYFRAHEDARFTFHNLAHTQNVVTAVTQIANHYQLNDEDFFAVSTAAWFHDTGYTGGKLNHEERSVENATEFLNGLKVESQVVDKVNECILATKLPQAPKNLLEKIICDADLYHFGTDDFFRKSRLLRKEIEALNNTKISKREWWQKTIEMIELHRYHTDYCQLLLTDKKEKNLEVLRAKMHAEEEKHEQQTKPDPLLPEVPEAQKKSAKSKERPTKGIETMFRITSNNHQRLSDMADSKAHIMISVNSIVISLLLSLLLRRLDDHPRQTIPAMLLLSVNLATIIFSILATRPNLPEGTFTQDDIDHRRVNLLFFGNFYKMSLEQYTNGMVSMMNDRDFLYGSLIRDLYAQGVVLGRKYRLLRISYSIFMYGLVASVLAFVLSSVL